jgi:hypothetical protein
MNTKVDQTQGPELLEQLRSISGERYRAYCQQLRSELGNDWKDDIFWEQSAFVAQDVVDELVEILKEYSITPLGGEVKG